MNAKTISRLYKSAAFVAVVGVIALIGRAFEIARQRLGIEKEITSLRFVEKVEPDIFLQTANRIDKLNARVSWPFPSYSPPALPKDKNADELKLKVTEMSTEERASLLSSWERLVKGR